MSVPPILNSTRPADEMPLTLPPAVAGAGPANSGTGVATDTVSHMNAYPAPEPACGKKRDESARIRANWAGNAVSVANRVSSPASVHELQIAVLDAVKTGAVPCVARGALHSWSPVATQTKGTAFDLSRLRLEPVVDKESGRVTVPAGMLLEDLFRILDENGLALTAVPMVRTATVAGAFATGSHGAHRDVGHFGELVAEVRLIDGQGRNVVIDESGCWQLLGGEKVLIAAGAGPLQAARRHRGVLGVIYQVTFACEPTYDIELTDTMMREEDAFGSNGEKLVAFAREHEYASMIWFPDQERVMMRTGDRTTEPRKPRSWFQRVVINDFVRGTLASMLMRAIVGVPKLAKAANFVAARAFPKETTYRDKWHEMQTYLPGHANEKSGLRLMEYGIKLEHAGRALDIMRETLGGFAVPMPVGMRRTEDDMQFEFMWPEGFEGAVEKAKELETRFIAEFGTAATPHEGKLFYQNPWSRYPEARREEFLTLKAALDPSGAFTNEFAAKFLGGGDLE